MNDRDIRFQRLIDAPIEATFHHWVDPHARRRWCAPQDDWMAQAISDLRVGGPWSVMFGPTAEERYTIEGVYLEVDPPNRLVYTSVFRYPDGRSFETLTTVTFEARSDQTLLTFLDAGYPADQDFRAFEAGTVAVLDAFARTVAASTS